MRLFEAIGAGLVVGAVVALIAWCLGSPGVLAGAVAFLAGFVGWAATGRTVARYGRRGGFWDID